MINQRLKEFLESEQISAAEFSRKIDKTKSYVSGLLSKPDSNPKKEFFDKLKEGFPDVNLNWFMYGDGQMYLSEEKPPIKLGREDFVEIPIKDEIYASAGQGYSNFSEEESLKMLFTRRFAKSIGISFEDSHIISVRGDSMYPTFEDGDEIIVDTSKTRICSNRTYCCNLNDDTFVKRLDLDVETGEILLISDNPEYDDIYVDPRVDVFRVIGEVMWVCRNV